MNPGVVVFPPRLQAINQEPSNNQTIEDLRIQTALKGVFLDRRITLPAGFNRM
jgi:hypothetical protein